MSSFCLGYYVFLLSCKVFLFKIPSKNVKGFWGLEQINKIYIISFRNDE